MTEYRVSLSEAVTNTAVGRGSAAGGLSPIRLPRVRDQTARFIADPTGPLAENFPQHRNGFELVVRHLRAADLYWVTPDMAALAVAAGAQLDTIRWTNLDRPSGCGLILFAGGVGMASVSGAELPVDAMSWGPAPDGIAVTMFCGRWRLDPRIAEEVTINLPPLLVAKQDDLGGGDGHVSVDTLGSGRTLLCTLAATWALMQQPTISDRTRAPVDKSLARSYRRAGRPEPEVSIVDLRHIYQPPADDDEDTQSSRVYRHRWVVRGHWRDQAHGPARALRRRIYVPAYIKGPDGAPLLDRERVNVWRR